MHATAPAPDLAASPVASAFPLRAALGSALGALRVPAPAPFVLQVEDSPDDVELLHEAFRELRIDVRFMTLATPLQAFSMLRLLPTNGLPNLIILDLSLPSLDGHEVLRRINQDHHWRYIPTVIMTSSTDELDRARSFALGAVEHLVKPTLYSALMQQAMVLARYLQSDR